MHLNMIMNKSSIIILLIFTILFIKLNYAFTERTLKDRKLLLLCKKKCQNRYRKLRRFCIKCQSLGMLDKNKNSGNKNYSTILFYNSTKFDYNETENLIDSGDFIIPLLSNSNTFHYNQIKNLIVFGDSHSSIQDTNFKDMTYIGRNASHGKNWPLYLIEFNNMKLWNYAMGGSVVDNKLVNKEKWTRKDLKSEYIYFYENMSKGKKFYNQWKKENSLFAIWIGNRDVALLKSKNVTEEIDKITNSLFDTINELYNIGARNILILEVYPRYKIPNYEADLDYIKNNVIIFNNSIMKKSKLFFEKHIDINIFIYKTIDVFEEIISNCNKYKFKDCVNAWVKNKKNNINDYFWVNSHINDLGNKLIAKNINDILNSINS